MRKTFLKIFSAGLLAAGSLQAGASGLIDDYRQAVREGSLTHELNIDNDSLLLNRDDGFYTSGFGYAQRHALRSASGLTVFGWRLGQQLYTASDIKLPPGRVGPPDHPYAGWLYGGFFKETYDRSGAYSKIGIDLGCLGPCAGGEWTQKNLHRIIDQPLPRGWGKQVRNEVGVVLHADYAPLAWKLAPWADLTPSIKGRFGNIFTDAGAGLLLRLGHLPGLPGDAGFHAFARLDGRAVAYNATLEGGYFSSGNPHTVDPRRFVAEAEGGVAWSRGPYGVRASIVRRGNEIRGLPDSTGTQNFVRLLFSYTP
jgi:hypothetical protein